MLRREERDLIDIPIKPRGGGNVRRVAVTKKQQVEELLAIAAQTGVPAAQRDPDMMATLRVPQIGSAPRTTDKTIRRLTRVERLLRAGVLERHEADACEWYAEVTALAWDTTGTTANYEGGGSGGGSAHAPDRLMAKRQDIAWARDDYREARALLGGTMATAFEAVVCRNEGLGPTAAAAFPDLARSQAGERMRTMLKFCANVLHDRFGGLMGWSDAPVLPASPSPAKAGPAKAEPVAMAILPDIVAAIEARSAVTSEIWVAAAVYDQLRQELGVLATDVIYIDGAPLVVREHWRWGWVLVDAAGSA